VGLAAGDTLILEICDIAFGGEGVARVADFVVFVPFVALGEIVEAEITELKKRFARARLLKILRSSPDRVEARCQYFGGCGGCQYQHLKYATQLWLKHKQVCDLFQRIGSLELNVIKEVVPCPKPYGYRNRIMLRSQWDKFKQRLNIGFLRAESRLVVDIEECKIAEPLLNAQIRHLRTNPPPKGGVKVMLRIQPEGWVVPPDSFFQNNFFLLPKLVEIVRESLGQSGSQFLVDLYCGVGFFAIETGDLVRRFAGVEYDRLAIKAARENAAVKKRVNGEFIAGKAESVLPELFNRFEPHLTTVLIDPPRKGCAREMLELLRQIRPLQVIYVSCHPATMARDLNVLCAEGVFRVAQVVPLDMFPQTAHIECVADLRNSFVSPEPMRTVNMSTP